MNDAPLRPTAARVDLGQLAANLHAIRRQVSPARVMPVVKANAYGHGLAAVARHLLANGADMLGVAILDEGLALRQQGISGDVLVLGGVLAEQIAAYLEHNLILTVASLDVLEQVEAAAARAGRLARVHIKVDTGMSRLGVPYQEAGQLFQASLGCEHVRVEGVFSHFANSDAADLSHARLQLARFQQALQFYPQHGLPYPQRHIANSGGILQLPESYLDMVRPGIMLYGVYPSAEAQRSVLVRPALTWVTRAVQVKTLPAHTPVSYGSTWQSDQPVRILTLPVGYADGYFRLLSNRGQVLVRGRRYPVVGRVCMDQILVNLGDDPAELGEEVVLLGGESETALQADDLAGWAQTIGYEILTNISARVPRVYWDSTQQGRAT